MRTSAVLFTVILAASAQAHAQAAPGCTTGLCLKQISCPGGGTTSISGTVYAPNGTDPLPDVLVYIPNATVPAFTPGVSCDVVGAPPPGSPLVGTVTAVDGTFTIANVPVDTNIPIVVQTGRWRRQAVVDTSAGSCANTAVLSDSIRMPKNHIEGDIPKIAVATGSVDQVECVLRKVGIADTEFSDSNGTGRIVLYPGSAGAGTRYPDVSSAQTESDLMGTAANLNAYDMLMLPCEGTAGRAFKTAQELNNLQNFANSGGRVYASHYSYAWLDQRFSGVARWTTSGNSTTALSDGIATVDTSFSAGNTLGQWLQLPAINASIATNEMQIFTLKQDTNGVIAPTQSWLTLNDPADGNPVMQFVFDTPILPAGSTGNQCGRVLFNEYHVENASSSGTSFPSECNTSAAMTPQEKLLEYSLFELTADGSSATLAPATQDFGSETVGFPSASQTFTWTNNSTFAASVTLLTASGDFSVGTNTCTAIASGSSCSILVTFTPTALGARTGTLTVGSPGSTLTSSLTGTGTPGYTIPPALVSSPLTFSSVDVGGSASQIFLLTNIAPGGLPAPSLVTTGDYSATSNCASTVPAGSSCAITVTFSPTTTGTRAGNLAVSSGVVNLPVSLTGNGVDFSLSVSPGSGSVIAGYSVTTTVTATSIAGFSAPVSLSCTTTASASACTAAVPNFVLSEVSHSTITITTTSRYTVVGYGGLGGGGWLWLIAVGSGCLVWMMRRRSGIARSGVLVLLLAAAFSLTACSGKLPGENSVYTAPGANTYTLTATDGIITHSVTYTLNVSAK